MRNIKIINNDIVLKDEDFLTDEEFNNAKINSRLETELKKKFIQIIKRNTNNGLVIKMIDLKNLYSDRLEDEIKEDPYVIQIFKNLAASNKDNGTHLLRDANIDWYYVEPEFIFLDHIEVLETERKPFPIPKDLERSRRKRYFVFHTSNISDSPITTVQELILNEPEVSEELDYNSYDFNNIPIVKEDYIEKQKRAEKIGLIGEEYVLELERKYLNKHSINEEPIRVSEKNDSFGFDILSYRKRNREVKQVYIEVKTTNGNLETPFHVTENELKVSNLYDESYILYRVYRADDPRNISHIIINGKIESNNNLSKIRTKSEHIYKVKRWFKFKLKIM